VTTMGPARRGPLVVAMVLGLACRPAEPSEAPPPAELRRDEALTAEQAQYLAALVETADRDPDDVSARKASGLAHMRFALSGVLSLQTRAEADLEAAFRLDPGDPELTRSLGRFYNMRAVAGDDSKAALQVEVYRALLGDRPVTELDTRHFTAWAFAQLGQVLTQKNRGRVFEALGTVRALEAELERRTEASPQDIELFALAGNFAFFFAGNIPLGREDRVRQAVRYFEVVREHWPKMRFGARDPEHCPNTYENFMFELAEGYTVLGEVAPAREIYTELAERSLQTRAQEQIAYVSAERLRNHAEYLGKHELMPPWPSDVGNCVVCHAYTSDVPLTSLHSVEPLRLSDIPTRARSKPVASGPVPSELRALVEQHCTRCHRRGAAAEAAGDFTSDEAVLARARAIRRRVEDGEMPPDRPLPPAFIEAFTGAVEVIAPRGRTPAETPARASGAPPP